jgi:hypothetical protein
VQILWDARHALLLMVNKQEQRDVTFTAKTIQMSNKSKGHRRTTIIHADIPGFILLESGIPSSR